MGFWKSVGKFAGKAALGVMAPGVLAGLEYHKAKEKQEILLQFDESIESLFNSLAKMREGDTWKELLALVRSCVVGFLKNDEERNKLLKSKNIDANESGRICCALAMLFCEQESIIGFAEGKGIEIDELKVIVGIAELICQELDKRIATAGLVPKEESVVRALFDSSCTCQPHLVFPVFTRMGNDASGTLETFVKGLFALSANDDNAKPLLALCEANKVSYSEIKRKLGF